MAEFNLLKPPPPLRDNPELSSFLTDVFIKFNDLQYRQPPASSTAVGTPGDLAFDSNYFYVCYLVNTWARIAYTDIVF